MENTIHWIFPLLNIFVYGIILFLILKRKKYSQITMRTPTLLLSTIISNFFLNEIILLDNIFSSHSISSFYYFFRLTMILSIILRYERLIACCDINKDINNDINRFYKKRKLFIEKYYVKVFIILTLIFFVLTIIIIIIGKEYLEAFFINSKDINKSKLIIDVVWNFIEEGILVTYIFRIYHNNNLHKYIRYELYIYLIIWFVNSIFSFLYAYINKDKLNLIIIVTSGALYSCLLINGAIPIIMTFGLKVFGIYYFPSKLMNNLYLFLTNEQCYKSFIHYFIIRKDEEGLFYMKLYTYIMKYRLNFFIEPDNINKIFNEAVNIYKKFFEDKTSSKFINIETLVKIKEDYKIFTNINRFDAALKYVYDKLTIKFKQFKDSIEFDELRGRINIASYINCKMYNTGLINEF